MKTARKGNKCWHDYTLNNVFKTASVVIKSTGVVIIVTHL